MQSSQRTAIGAYLQTTNLLGLNYKILDHTTLNEKFRTYAARGINQSTKEFSGTPAIRYMAIGNGGHDITTSGSGANTANIGRPTPVPHKPKDTGLYSYLPFVLKLASDGDLTPTERSKYRMRVIESHGGETYIAYYLKVLDLTNTSPTIEKRTIADGNINTQSYEFTIDNLDPQKPIINTGNSISSIKSYAVATAKVEINLNSDDITNLKAACEIKYGDENYAIISEVALCSGDDDDIEAVSSGTVPTPAYKEAIGVQIFSFINTFYSAPFNNSGINLNIELGSVETLLDI